jgi:hypothetical protein
MIIMKNGKPRQMVLLKDTNCQLGPEGNKNRTVTSIKIKWKDEVGHTNKMG